MKGKLEQKLKEITSNEAKELYSQINSALANNEHDLALELGKKAVDIYVNNKWTHDWDIIPISSRLAEWNNKEISEYAISKFSEKNTRDSLEYARDTARYLGRKEDAEKFIEKLYDLTIKLPKQFHYAAADYALQLGKYDDAINLYMDAGWFENALSAAKSYSEGRIKEVARKSFEKGPSDDPRVYFESAEILGAEDLARKTLQDEARNAKIQKSPSSYVSLVIALNRIGLKDDAETLVDKIRFYELNERKSKNIQNLKELANIYSHINKPDEEKNIRDLIIERDRDYGSN